MPTSPFSPSIRDSETVTCRRCNTRQYPRNGECIRCHNALSVDYVTIKLGDLLDSRIEDHSKQLARSIGDLLRRLRKRRGIYQAQLARMAVGTERSYLSKAECGLVLLSLSKLLPLAKALGLTCVILRFDAPVPRAVQKSSCIH